jgi:hypothetical protein
LEDSARWPKVCPRSSADNGLEVAQIEAWFSAAEALSAMHEEN